MFGDGLIDLRRVFYVETQTRDAGIDAGQVVGAADGADIATRQRFGRALAVVGCVDVNVVAVRFVARHRQLAARRHQVELLNREAEYHIVERKEDDALRDQHPPVGRQRVAARQHHIHQTGAKAEAGDPVHAGGDKYRDAGQHRVDDVKHRRDEHKGELQRLGNAGEEGREGRGQHDAADFNAVFRSRAVIDRQRRARQAEHHDREEARLIASRDADNAGAVSD